MKKLYILLITALFSLQLSAQVTCDSAQNNNFRYKWLQNQCFDKQIKLLYATPNQVAFVNSSGEVVTIPFNQLIDSLSLDTSLNLQRVLDNSKELGFQIHANVDGYTVFQDASVWQFGGNMNIVDNAGSGTDGNLTAEVITALDTNGDGVSIIATGKMSGQPATNSNEYVTLGQLQDSSGMVILSSIEDLQNYTGSSNSITVSDTTRGGLFTYTTESLFVDSGIVFPATGKGSGVWVRNQNEAITPAYWYGIEKNNYDNWYQLKNLFTSPYTNTISIGQSLNDTFNITAPLPLKSGQTVINNSVLRNQNNIRYLISDSSTIGQKTIYLDSANFKFKVGDQIGVNDTATPDMTGTGGQTARRYNAGTVLQVYSDSLIIDSAITYSVLPSRNGNIFRANSLLVGTGITDVNLIGGIYEGNKENNTIGEPVANGQTYLYSGSVIVFTSSKNINVDNVYAKSSIVSNIRFNYQTDNVLIQNSRFKYASDKNCLVFGWLFDSLGVRIKPTNYTFENCEFDSANYEDGIIIYRGGKDIYVNNCKFRNNGRFGLHIREAENVVMSGNEYISNGLNQQLQSINYVRSINELFRGVELKRVVGFASYQLYMVSLTDYKSTNMIMDSLQKANANIVVVTTPQSVFENTTFKNSNISSSFTKILLTTSGSTPQRIIMNNTSYVNVDSAKIFSTFAPNQRSTQFNILDIFNSPNASDFKKIFLDTLGKIQHLGGYYYDTVIARNLIAEGGLGAGAISTYRTQGNATNTAKLSEGTTTNPTASNAERGFLVGLLPYNGTSFTYQSRIDFRTGEMQSATNRGSRIDFWTTPLATTTMIKSAVLNESGTWYIISGGSPSDPSIKFGRHGFFDDNAGYLRMSINGTGTTYNFQSTAISSAINGRAEISFGSPSTSSTMFRSSNDPNTGINFDNADGSSMVNGGVTSQTWNSDASITFNKIPAAASGKYDLLTRDSSTGNVTKMQVLNASTTLDFPNTSPGTSSDLTMTLQGAADGDIVSISFPNASMPSGNVNYTYWVSATNTITIRFANNDAVTSKDPASGTFKARIIK